MFSDNSVLCDAFNNVNSSFCTIFDFVLELRTLELQSQSVFHVFHVYGNIMKSQGTDSFSQGNISQGVGLGEAFEPFVPFSKTALWKNMNLEDWLRS